MRSTRVLVGRLTAGGDEVEVDYADVFVVVREGEDAPGENDWEVNVRSRHRHRLEPGEHDLEFETLEGSTLNGRALLRYSDGHRHLFRGESRLIGFVA